MNCDEFRSYLLKGNPPEGAAAHAELCAECRNLAFEEAELHRAFQLVRDAAPDVRMSLDDSVMTAYRQQMTHPGGTSTRRSLSARLVWTGVAAGLIIIFGALFAANRRPVPTDPPPLAHKITVPAVPASKQARAIATKQSGKPARQGRKLVAAKRQRPDKREESRVGLLASEVPETGFRNLMYCDPLSCSGAMQVFRIQLPVSDVEPVSAWRSPTGLVQADVVVGADGIARAIRIVR